MSCSALLFEKGKKCDHEKNSILLFCARYGFAERLLPFNGQSPRVVGKRGGPQLAQRDGARQRAVLYRDGGRQTYSGRLYLRAQRRRHERRAAARMGQPYYRLEQQRGHACAGRARGESTPAAHDRHPLFGFLRRPAQPDHTCCMAELQLRTALPSRARTHAGRAVRSQRERNQTRMGANR